MGAAEKGHKDVVQLLLSAGANVESANKVSWMFALSFIVWSHLFSYSVVLKQCK